MSHVPVLLQEVLQILKPQPKEIVVDATLGAAGHAEAMMRAVGDAGMLLAIDTDIEALKNFAAKFRAKNAIAVHGNFADIKDLVEGLGFKKVNVVLFDFGLSSDQLDNPARGFSFQKSGPLDMRFDQTKPLTAEQIVNGFKEKDLEKIFREYGEEKNSRRLAKAIVRVRSERPIKTTDELFDLIKNALPANVRHKAGDVARRIFQALRIAVNNELVAIERGLRGAFEILARGGRMGAISFHSLEDRIVKQYFKELSCGCVCPPEFPVCRCGHEAEGIILTPKPVMASDEEQRANPRSKSAKFRVIKKVRD